MGASQAAVSCPGRGAAFFMPLRRAGTVPTPAFRYGPGSAAHRFASATRCAASGARERGFLSRRVGKGAFAPCPPSTSVRCWSIGGHAIGRALRVRRLCPPYAVSQNGISSSMSLLRPPAPAATARRGAPLLGPPDPKSPPESSDPKLPPPPPLRPSSMVRLELNPCSTTSVEYFSTPLWSVHFRVCSAPSM